MNPATGEEIVEHFRTYDHNAIWSENWSQGPESYVNDPQVSGTSTTIQGVLCCVDRDETISWLLMILDHPAETPAGWVVTYLCTTYTGDERWPWAWIEADDNLDACSEFVKWLQLDEDYKESAVITRIEAL